MTINDLSKELNEMYNNAPDNEQSLMIRLFEICFAKEIWNNKITPLEIIQFANKHYSTSLKEDCQTEINKGIKLSEFDRIW
ncbi:MAG: hypothetical protein LBK66_05840 [Spirochaetaceae bacterium]|jgi:hypothetical protein|nr:hypothetical protein [Spirochaetaceae bacterium]